MARTFSDGVEGQPGAAPVSTLASGISIGATSSTVATGEGTNFPATGDFSIRFEDATDPTHFENVTASARSTDVITHGPTTYAWDAGDKVMHAITKADLDAFAETGDLAAYQALSVIDAAGDLIVGSGADATTRLAKGSALQVLRVNAGATALEYATPAGGAVGDLLDFQRVKLTSNQVLTTSSTTFQNVTALVLAIAANEEIEFEVILRAGAASNTPDIKLGITGPSGASMPIYGGIGAVQASTGNSDGLMYNSAIAAFAGANWLSFGLVDANPSIIVLKFTVINGATPGNVQLQAAQATSSADAATIYAGSSMKGYRWA